MGDDAENKKAPAPRSYHFFVSYRVASDANLADKLADKLSLQSLPKEERMRVRVFLDRQSLSAGENYADEIVAALSGSCLYVPVLSEAALEPLLSLEPEAQDNLLWEIETALDLYAKHQIHILPLFIGTVVDGAYSRFAGFSNKFPAVASRYSSRTLDETMAKLFAVQGIFINPEELAEKIPAVHSRFADLVWPHYRQDWEDQAELGAERLLSCVQCKQTYRESENTPSSCIFHAGREYNGRYLCCELPVPRNPDPKEPSGCQRARHRAEHHLEYPYAAFSDYRLSIMGSTQFTDRWHTVEVANLEDGSEIKVTAGVILKGIEQGNLFVDIIAPQRGIRVVSFEVFKLEHMPLFAGSDKHYQISHATDDKKRSATIALIPNDDHSNVSAFEISILTESCRGTPLVHRVPFSVTDEGKAVCGKVEVVSPGGNIVELAPNGSYNLPARDKSIYYKGERLYESERREVDEFASFGDLPIAIKLTGPVTVNDVRAFKPFDLYQFPLVLANTSDKNINIASTKVFVRSRYPPDERDKAMFADWTSAHDVEILANGTDKDAQNSDNAAGFTILANNVLRVKMRVTVPTAKGYSFGFAPSAYRHPLLTEFEFSDFGGAVHHRVFESISYISPRIRERKEDLLLSMPVDNIPELDRVSMRISYVESSKKYEIRVPGRVYSFDETALRRLVYHALLENKTAIRTEHSTAEDKDTGHTIDALIDPSCQAVYAFKVTHWQNGRATEARGIVPVAPYGTARAIPDAPPPETAPATATSSDVTLAADGFEPLPEIKLATIPHAEFPNRVDPKKYDKPAQESPAAAAPAPAPAPAVDTDALASAVADKVADAIASALQPLVARLDKQQEAIGKLQQDLGKVMATVEDSLRAQTPPQSPDVGEGAVSPRSAGKRRFRLGGKK